MDWRHWRPHTLAELAEPVNLSAHRASKLERSLSDAEGRNNALFDELRHWAYPQVEIARRASYEVWYRQVGIRAQAMAAQLVSERGALPAREVGYVAGSVARYVYHRYTGAGGVITPEYRAQQAERGAKGALVVGLRHCAVGGGHAGSLRQTGLAHGVEPHLPVAPGDLQNPIDRGQGILRRGRADLAPFQPVAQMVAILAQVLGVEPSHVGHPQLLS